MEIIVWTVSRNKIHLLLIFKKAIFYNQLILLTTNIIEFFMIRAYAYLSKKYPLIHKVNILFVLILFPLFIFAKASTYKSKYLGDK
ncbi:hypothetical protein C9J46_05390 [Photobacterium sp. GB-36]|nr:hypothetical protein C9J46_05390 [Photobacterium sp. GB-36]